MTESTENGNGNGRVTLAIVGHRLTSIEATLAEIKASVKGLNDLVTHMETQTELNKQKLDDHSEDIKNICDELKVQKRDGLIWDRINSVAAVAAGILGISR